MDAIKKQASKLREHVAKQQQALLYQIGRFGAESAAIVRDEKELQCNQQLQDLYHSTRTAKHYQKDIIRGLQGFLSTSTKQMDTMRKFAQDCCKYGAREEDTNDPSPLARVAFCIGSSHSLVENHRETSLTALRNKVCEPLRALVKDPQLEDARLLLRHYERLWQEAESQAIEVARQRTKLKDVASGENSIKLQNEEGKLDELKSRLMALGKEANAAMSSVETNQQKQTFDRLQMMVEAERSYHHHALSILEKLLNELTSSPEIEAMLSSPDMEESLNFAEHGESADNERLDKETTSSYFIARAVHPFDALEEGELSLSVDDFVVVYEVEDGWCRGEHKNRIGWFPSVYVERVETAAAKSTR